MESNTDRVMWTIIILILATALGVATIKYMPGASDFIMESANKINGIARKFLRDEKSEDEGDPTELFVYEETNGGYAITGYNTAHIVQVLGRNYPKHIDIPSKYNGIDVVEIKVPRSGGATFKDLQSVRIPDSVERIEGMAFSALKKDTSSVIVATIKDGDEDGKSPFIRGFQFDEFWRVVQPNLLIERDMQFGKLNSDGNIEVGSHGEATSGFIDISELNYITMTLFLNSPTSSDKWMGYTFYDSSKSIIEDTFQEVSFDMSEKETGTHVMTTKVPLNAKYVRVSARHMESRSDVGFIPHKLKVEVGRKSTDWVLNDIDRGD